MVEDGMPVALALTAEQRRAARNLNTAITTMPTETATRLMKPETEEMKKMRAAAAKSATKKTIHVPRKPKKAAAAKTKNIGARTAVAKAVERLSKPAKPPKAAKTTGRPANPQTRVSGQAIGEATCVAGGVTMADLVKTFGIEAHPMRAKIHYAKHQLGYTIENCEGRYYGIAPKVTA